MFSGRVAPIPVKNIYSLAVAGSVHHKNSLFSVGRPTNMHFPSSEADVVLPRCASRMKFADIQNYSGSEADEKDDRSASQTGKARFPGFLGSEADENGSWWASRNGEPRHLVGDSGACRYCTLEIVSWWDSMLKIVSRDSMPGRLNTDTGVC